MLDKERAVKPLWAIAAVVLLTGMILAGLRWPSIAETGNPVLEMTKLILAGGVGTLVSSAHKRSNRDKLSRSMQQAEILLCVAGAMMMIIIGNSTARALGIAGGASIIRFRTPVKDPKDAIVFLLMLGLGMSCGLGNLAVAGFGAIFLSLFLVALGEVGSEKKQRGMMLEMVANGQNFPTEHVQSILAEHKIPFEPRELRQGKDTTLRYHVKLDAAISIEDLSAKLMNGPGALKSVSWDKGK
jgi:hypothetical protein